MAIELKTGNIFLFRCGVLKSMREKYSDHLKQAVPVFNWPDMFTPELLMQLILDPKHPSVEEIIEMCHDVG